MWIFFFVCTVGMWLKYFFHFTEQFLHTLHRIDHLSEPGRIGISGSIPGEMFPQFSHCSVFSFILHLQVRMSDHCFFNFFPGRTGRNQSGLQGFPWAPRPIIMPSHPVSSNKALAVNGSVTSPLPITGICTASFTARIISQSALPL